MTYYIGPKLHDLDSFCRMDIGASNVDKRPDPSLGFYRVGLEGQRNKRLGDMPRA